MKKEKQIVVLGTNGMVGSMVYSYLTKNADLDVYGTVRNTHLLSDRIFYLDVRTCRKDFIAIINKLKNVDYIINCIGILKTNTLSDYYKINSNFPKDMALLAQKYRSNMIHISTDGVFSQLSTINNETSVANPEDDYGKSKLLGEPDSQSTISIRSSFLGLDPQQHKGLLENILSSQHINGYTNQLWSGCTTLQFSQLCKRIIIEDTFQHMRNKSHIYHFAPLKNITKYEIIKKFLSIKKIAKAVTRTENKPITRQLVTRFQNEIFLDSFSSSLHEALLELISYY